MDTVLICNGAQDIPFIKASEDIHFCAKGLSKLPGKLQKLVAMTDDQKKTYSMPSNSYVRQYQDIPDSK